MLEPGDDIEMQIIDNMEPNARRDTDPSITAYDNTINDSEAKSEESIERKRGRWLKIRLMYLIIFLECFAWTMSFTSLWPYILSIEPTSSILFLTLVNFSRGLFEFATSILYGYWFDSRGPNEPLILSNVLFITGNLIYAIAGNVDRFGIWLILISRSLLGISGGAMTIGRSVATKLSKEDELSKALSYFGLGEQAAFFVAPIVSLFNAYLIGEDGLYVKQLRLHLNMYTVPVWILVIMGLINFLLQIKYFYRDYEDYCPKDIVVEVECNEESNTKRVDHVVVGVLLIVHLIIHMSMSLIETTSPYLKDYFALTKKELIIYSCILSMVYSLVSFIFCALVPFFSKKIMEKKLLLFGLIGTCIGCYLFIPFGPGKLKIAQPIEGINSTVTNITVTGCPSQYKWCYSSPTFPIAQLVVSEIILAIADPFAFSVSPSVYGSIIGPVNQGRYMELLTGMEPISKIFTPLLSGPLYAEYGLSGSYSLIGSLFFLAIIAFLFTWKRINP